MGPDDPDRNRRAGQAGAPPPVTPVDQSAYQHDLDYYRVQQGHRFSATTGIGVWLEGFLSFDVDLQSGLGWADLNLAFRTPWYVLKGMFDGSYGLDDWSAVNRHLAFGSDLAWTVGIFTTHTVLALHRFGMAALGLILEGSDAIIRFGKSIGGIGGTIIQGVGYAAYYVTEAVGYIWSAATGILMIGAGIASALAAPFIYVGGFLAAQIFSGVVALGKGLAFIGGKVIAGIAAVGKAIWDGIKSIGKAIGDFFDSIFMVSEAVRLASGGDGEVRKQMCRFRDEYVRHEDPDGRFLSRYYASAPHVVAAIDSRDDASAIWNMAYEKWLMRCLREIADGNEAAAFQCFKNMTYELSKIGGVRFGMDVTPRHWKRPCVTT